LNEKVYSGTTSELSYILRRFEENLNITEKKKLEERRNFWS
jgi:hypothetical protein